MDFVTNLMLLPPSREQLDPEHAGFRSTIRFIINRLQPLSGYHLSTSCTLRNSLGCPPYVHCMDRDGVGAARVPAVTRPIQVRDRLRGTCERCWPPRSLPPPA